MLLWIAVCLCIALATSSILQPPLSVLRAHQHKVLTNDPTPLIHTLSHEEAAAFILQHANLFLQLDEKQVDEKLDPECVPVPDVPDQNKYIDHTEQEWSTEINNFKKKYPIVKHIPGIGILGINSFNVKTFDGFISFKITKDRVRLLVHGSTGDSNCIYGKGKDYTDTNVMTLKIRIGKFEFLKKQKIETSTFLGFGTQYAQQITSLPLMSSVNIKLRVAIDANIKFEGQQWNVVKGQDVHVCVPSVVAAGLSDWTIKLLTFINPFSSTIDLKQLFQNMLYCQFKYNLPTEEALLPFLTFLRSSKTANDDETNEPLVEVSTRKKLHNIDEDIIDEEESSSTKDVLLTKANIKMKLQLPTMPFVEYLVVAGKKASLKRLNAVSQREGGGTKSGAGDQDAGEKVEDGLNAKSMEAAADELTKYFDAMAHAFTNEENNMMAATVKTISDVLFDLDNDLKGKYQGSIALKNSKDLLIHIQNFYVQGHVKNTKLPIGMFIDSLETLNDIQNMAQHSQRPATTMEPDGAKIEEDLTRAMELTGTVTMAKCDDIEIGGNFIKLVKRPKDLNALMSSLFGPGASYGRQATERLIQYLIKHPISLSLSTKDNEKKKEDGSGDGGGGGGGGGAEQMSIDKRNIVFSSHLSYTGPFEINGILTTLTKCANAAADYIVKHDQVVAKRQQCIEATNDLWADELEDMTEHTNKQIDECMGVAGFHRGVQFHHGSEASLTRTVGKRWDPRTIQQPAPTTATAPTNFLNLKSRTQNHLTALAEGDDEEEEEVDPEGQPEGQPQPFMENGPPRSAVAGQSFLIKNTPLDGSDAYIGRHTALERLGPLGEHNLDKNEAIAPTDDLNRQDTLQWIYGAKEAAAPIAPMDVAHDDDPAPEEDTPLQLPSTAAESGAWFGESKVAVDHNPPMPSTSEPSNMPSSPAVDTLPDPIKDQAEVKSLGAFDDFGKPEKR